jgi:hypothetical protein
MVAMAIATYVLIRYGINESNTGAIIAFFVIFFVSYLIFIFGIDRFKK